ncbi:hypothetical protein OGAPHI_003527 [Ogataea philodendri]|uniref:2,5-diamino-6-ribosylamino-4(3H)-pyrimidinone 5'-phosphate reductase n=1 Tax=Ogataea philodendri TaxID=1378263 RepID=A0A9P8T5Y2_9ASCO|nr:uncharacterized protein OGAPHI_003527 [Ogataea philodendri]KAH3666530.1 hypothetical protein OGAPHI_003527 [Ogataea philodendri]
MAPLSPLAPTLIPFLDRYLPPTTKVNSETGLNTKLPFVTLTYAQSLDSRISKAPGVQTVISHLETKTMTHYIRSKHDAILIGIGTFLADDPGLNCRFQSPMEQKVHLIRPVIIDPTFQLGAKYETSRLRKTAEEGLGLPPIVVVDSLVLNQNPQINTFCQKHRIILIDLDRNSEARFVWEDVFAELGRQTLNSVMVEGGASIIESLLSCATSNEDTHLINSLIITIGPVFLGKSGVEVSPMNELRLSEVNWWKGIRDSVVCARLNKQDHRS